jgi:hypothetical protein
MESSLRVELGSGLRELRCLLFQAPIQRFALGEALFRRVAADIFCDAHGTEVRAAHGAEVRSLGAFLRQSLTKPMPIIFALGGLAVNSSLCRLVPGGSIHHGLE